MKILHLKVENFRGIRFSEITFPEQTKIAILIGSGDSTKSTLLTAIRWNLWPSWNLQASDTDFYNKNIKNKIVITGTYGYLPSELLSEDKFGLFLRAPDKPYDNISNDEPLDGKTLCVTIRLTIDESLEPRWEIVCNRKEPMTVSASDRKKFAISIIGEDAMTDLMWGRNSILHQFINSKDILHDAYIKTMREVAECADLSELDSVAEIVEQAGKEYGVGFNGTITNRLTYQNTSFTNAVGLFDDNTPLSMRGLGSRRLLSIALNISLANRDSLLIIDEIEHGLEPYRIKSLINLFRTKLSSKGQIIFTTHSPVVVSEAKINELMFVNSKAGETKINQLPLSIETLSFIQGQIRSNADAFLSKRLIICEGKTEIGYLRAFDNYIDNKCHVRMAYYGVGTFLGTGKSVLDCADMLSKLGYDVCVFMDSDNPDEETGKKEIRNKGIPVFDWEAGNSIEDQLFLESSLEAIQEFINIATIEKGVTGIKSQLENVPIRIDNERLILETEMLTVDVRKRIGNATKGTKKQSGWFKRIDLGELVGDVVFNHINEYKNDGCVCQVNRSLLKWIKKVNG